MTKLTQKEQEFFSRIIEREAQSGLSNRQNPFQSILMRAYKKGIIPNQTKAARQWFRGEASKFSNTRRLLENFSKDQRMKTAVAAGFMYMFAYDAKTKDKLEYWDACPLIFPIKKYRNGFLGINLHYLSPTVRAALFDELYKIVSNDRFDETTKLKISYELLASSSRFKAFRPCVKRYLYKQVRSPFMTIYSWEWDICMMLPTAKFQKKSPMAVWRDSARKISK